MSEGEYPDTTAEAKDKATQDGLEIIVATDHMIQLDLDTAADLFTWERREHSLEDIGVIKQSVETWESKSGNRHVLIHMKEPMPIIRRIAIQLALGSDRKREFLALRDVHMEYEFPLMLFRPKAKGAIA